MTVPTGPGAYGEASGYAADPAYGYTAPYVTAAHVDTLSYADPSQYTVTVVVAAYNASATLDRALRSALNQTHRGVEVLVVDDASTDGTLEVAHQYARQDSRVRVVPRPYNSGGVGAPRNNGIESATGQYLLFLDADDELPHKACEVLLASALATGAEITAGRALRINLAKDETTVWQPQLYATDRTVSGGLAAAPELFDDPIAAAKLFRVDFLHHHGIRFPEGVFFEDTYFSTVAGFCARNITLLTAPVYRWMWERESDTPSITNRRAELRSIRDRVLVHQWADEFLARHGGQDLIAHKGAKFLSHDLRLYTPELRAGDEAYRDGFVRVTAPYLRSLPSDAYDLCGPMERVRAFALINGQVDLALSAADYTQRRSVLSSDLVERDGKVYWSGALLGRPHAERFLDVTELDLTGTTLGDARLFNQATRVVIRDGKLHVTGFIRNQFGRVGPKDKIELTAVLRRRSPKTDHTFKVTGVEVDEDYIRYHTSVDLDETVGRAGRPATWNLFVQLRHAGQRATTTVCVRGLDLEQERYRADGTTYEIYETVSGNLALRQETSEQRVKADPRGTPWLWWATRRLPESVTPQERYGAAVVVHCHNDEYNLYEFLSSLAAQRDFERTQVVLVDDGSTDATPGHLANFAAHYPNTRVVPQVAMGMRAAYDHGLRHVTAPYVMFARARDILGEDSVSHLLRAARKTKADIAVGDPDNFPGPPRGDDAPWKRYFGKKPADVSHLQDAPYLVFSTGLGAKLLKTKLVRDQRLRCGGGPGFEDAWMAVPALLHARRVALAPKATCYERDREQSDSLFDLPWNDAVKAQELIRLAKHLLKRSATLDARTRRLAQRFVVRTCQPYLRNLHRIMSRTELAAIFPALCDVYAEIPDDLILQYATAAMSRLQHHAVRTGNLDLFCEPHTKPDYRPYLKIDEQGVYRQLAADRVDTSLLRVDRQKVVLETCHVDVGKVTFEGLMVLTGVDICHIFANRVQLVLSDGRTERTVPVEQVYRRDRWRTRKEQDWYAGWRAVARPEDFAGINNRDLSLTLRVHDGDRHLDTPVDARQMLHRFKGVHRAGRATVLLTIDKDEKITLRRVAGTGRRLGHKTQRFLKEFRAALPGRPGWRTRLLYWLFHPGLRGKDIWIIGEREDTAQDNSYHLFKWIRENEPRRKVYYAINGDSADREKIAHLGQVIDRLSWKYRVYLLHATRLINAYDLEAYLGFPGLSKRAFLTGYGDLLRYRRVFLQHGVVYNDVAPSIHAQVTNVDMVLTTGRSERAYYAEHCGYGYDRVAATGLPRFDALKPVPGLRRVLVMPTWRRDIVAPSYNKAAKPEIPFAASEYYRFFSSLLRDERLLKALQYYNVELEFMPHYEIRPYLKHFRIDHPSITVSTTGRDVQLAMRECSMLVTDYSSVFFDVAYMGKPIVYTNFDDEAFYSKHYKRGYFDLARDGFGPTCATVDQAVDEIIASIERGFEVEPRYRERAEEFFVLRDTNNCERAFDVIDTMDSAVVGDPGLPSAPLVMGRSDEQQRVGG
ncbi:bifunctional glycosyltransferase/CDP-glycerol:glycerophosphate glycerophosphotransferase [Streptomyces rochei]|uniref:bifunctional glycosyltransferase/CDP-glycerol:glycerophosphate glycerophosphotransferase n=1 Tax=Streptomyces rochei TaxID=1928 RepID=UPI0013BE8394|nr:glycosyltransferase [Streptomyces rochei]NEC73101.1 glycosyltransferase [Streptomyces rochei]